MKPRKAGQQKPQELRQRSQEQDAPDRRSRQRFSLRLPGRFGRIGPRSLLDRIVIGQSVNFSSTGLLFTTSEAFLPGQAVKACIDWPIRLHHRVRLTLIVEGLVVRSKGNYTAMHIEKYQFKTSGPAGVAVVTMKQAVR